MKIIIKFLFVLAGILAVSCQPYAKTHKYGIGSHSMSDLNSDYGFGKCFLVDSVKGLEFKLLVSENGHMFLVPENSMCMLTAETNESTIFQIPGAGLFRWHNFPAYALTIESIMKIVSAGYAHYSLFNESVRLQNQYMKCYAQTKHFDVVECKLKPGLLYKFLVRGDFYQKILVKGAFDNYIVIYPGTTRHSRVLSDSPDIEYVKFINPYSYYPLYIPKFMPESRHLVNLDSINRLNYKESHEAKYSPCE